MDDDCQRWNFVLEKKRKKKKKKRKRKKKDTYITTLSTKEMADMPFGTTSNNNLALDGRLTTLAPGTETLMKVQVAIKPQSLVSIRLFERQHVVHGGAFRNLHVDAIVTLIDPFEAFVALVVGFRVEGYAFEVGTALVTFEARGMEAFARRAENATGNWEGAVST